VTGLRARFRKIEDALGRRPCPDCGGNPIRYVVGEGPEGDPPASEPVGEPACSTCRRAALTLRMEHIEGITLEDFLRDRKGGSDAA
jgi:predicted  nucleic acid-binding Zn-ribbon protein